MDLAWRRDSHGKLEYLLQLTATRSQVYRRADSCARSPRARLNSGEIPEAIDHIAKCGPRRPRNQQAIRFVIDQIGHSARIGGDYGHCPRHSFEQSQRHAFDERGKHKNIMRSVERGHRVAREKGQDRDSIADRDGKVCFNLLFGENASGNRELDSGEPAASAVNASAR